MSLLQEKRCLTCQGSKEIMGGGMMMKKCPDCEGVGKLYVANDEIKYLQEVIKATENANTDIGNDKNISVIPVIKKRGRPFRNPQV